MRPRRQEHTQWGHWSQTTHRARQRGAARTQGGRIPSGRTGMPMQHNGTCNARVSPNKCIHGKDCRHMPHALHHHHRYSGLEWRCRGSSLGDLAKRPVPPPSTSLRRERKEQRWDRSRGLFWHGRRGLLWCWHRLALCLHGDVLIGPLLRHTFRNGLTKCLHICLRRNLCCSQPQGMRVYLSVVSLDIE